MAIRSILVTGGAGYIGSHLVDRLVMRGYTVTVLDNLEPQVHRSGTWPSYANARAQYVRGDIRDRSVLEALVLASDAVVHFAAAVSVGQSMYQIDRYVDVNTRGTALLLDILVNTRHHVEKVLVASSIGVYGEGAYRCDLCGPVAPGIRSVERLAEHDWEQHCPSCGRHVASVPTPEDKPLYRDNIYSMTKYHQEEMVLLIGKTYSIPAVAPRFFNVYGPRQSLSNPYAGVAAIWLSRLMNDRQPVVFEDGGQLRDFVSIHDVVDCLTLMIETPGADYLPINVGSGQAITILEIASLLARLLDKSIEPQVTLTGRKFDIRHNTADITRARDALGFQPKITLEQGFSELIEWARSTGAAEDFFDRALQELQAKGLLVSGTAGR
jgi:dTDP-L-rhamnose 4-epimerase